MPFQHTDGNTNVNNINSKIFDLLGSYSVYIGTHFRTYLTAPDTFFGLFDP